MLTQEQFDNERDYCALLALAGAMRTQGVIGEQDFHILRRKLLKQYRPAVSCLQAEDAGAFVESHKTPPPSP